MWVCFFGNVGLLSVHTLGHRVQTSVNTANCFYRYSFVHISKRTGISGLVHKAIIFDSF